MKIKIKHRLTGATLFERELPAEIQEHSQARQLGYAIRQAYLAGANLADAYLAGAYLADANLTGANLAGANLADADLADAYLADAYLADAYLTGANLTDAYLADAYLEPVSQEHLAQERAMPSWEREQRRAQRFRERNPDVPILTAIDAQILGAIESGNGRLEMSQWHSSCGTSHCRAGWAITLAGEAGKNLERRYGPARAGRMIYTASAGYTPHFFAGNNAALADIRARAAEQSSAAS